jgi:hypothetical protein
MTHIKWLRTGGYVAIQLAGMAPMIALLRWGSGSFGLPFASTVILCLGWGSALFAMAAPALPSHAWSIGFAEFLRRGIAALLVAGALGAAALKVPFTSEWIATQANASMTEMSAFVALGALRSLGQTATTYSIRAERHGPLLATQAVGRLLEIALVTAACMSGESWLLAVGLAVYPLAQSTILLGGRETRIGPSGQHGQNSFGSFAANASAQLAEIAVPAAWLALGGPHVFVAYKIASAAMANTAMLPRYWYVVAGTTASAHSVLGGCLAGIVAVVACGALHWISAVAGLAMVAWSMIPVAAGAFAAVGFSRLRQISLNAGDTVTPAVAVLGGRLAELAVLFAAASVASAASGWLILAAIAQPMSAFILHKAGK